MNWQITSPVADSDEQLAQALCIWEAGVREVDPSKLVKGQVYAHELMLHVGGQAIPILGSPKIRVVGCGKAGEPMVLGLEAALAGRSEILDGIVGWVNVPDNIAQTARKIHLHGARPVGENSPTKAGIFGTQQMLNLASDLGPGDLLVNLVSGGGSALTPAPIDGISLENKIFVTQFLSRAGATIQELNTVRKQLSDFKGGKLAKLACKRGARCISLILSDVLADPLDVIASGPTAEDTGTPEQALAVLQRFDRERRFIPASVWAVLEAACGQAQTPFPHDLVHNIIIGNNNTAIDAAYAAASQFCGNIVRSSAPQTGEASVIGARLAESVKSLLVETGHRGQTCLVWGGETTVDVCGKNGKGGRSQEMALGFLNAFQDASHLLNRISAVFGGTDGEDGPGHDAAGACVTAEIYQEAMALGLQPRMFLDQHNSYEFFAPSGGLLKTGLTGTNVCDVAAVVFN